MIFSDHFETAPFCRRARRHTFQKEKALNPSGSGKGTAEGKGDRREEESEYFSGMCIL